MHSTSVASRIARFHKVANADSDQQGGKSFVPSHTFAHDYDGLIGQYKLD